MSLSNRAVIAGVGLTAQGKVPGSTNLGLAVEAFDRALDDAGLDKSEVDGLLTEPATTEFGWALDYLRLGETLGINPRYTGSLMQGGATAGSLVQLAAMAVATGMANVVACVFGDAARTGPGPKPTEGVRTSENESWDVWGAYGAMSWSAMSASRHMALYGTSEAQLGQVAVNTREFATLNPEAVMRQPITLEDYLDSPWIVEPLRLLDCCLVTDGGACIIVTTPERAKDLKSKPVNIAGMGQAYTTQKLEKADWWYGPHQGTAISAAYEMAGVGPRDIKVAELYDNFTISTITWLEHAGFCGVGEGGPFMQTGETAMGGRLPVNTHGGHLSGSHPEGWLTVIEGVRQVRGDAPGFQVQDADVCLVTGRGMLLNCASALVLTS